MWIRKLNKANNILNTVGTVGKIGCIIEIHTEEIPTLNIKTEKKTLTLWIPKKYEQNKTVSLMYDQSKSEFYVNHHVPATDNTYITHMLHIIYVICTYVGVIGIRYK